MGDEIFAGRHPVLVPRFVSVAPHEAGSSQPERVPVHVVSIGAGESRPELLDGSGHGAVTEYLMREDGRRYGDFSDSKPCLCQETPGNDICRLVEEALRHAGCDKGL